jgi:hypothetical protein
MGVPTSEFGYTSVTTRKEDHEVHKGHVVALGGLLYHMEKAVKCSVYWRIIMILSKFHVGSTFTCFKEGDIVGALREVKVSSKSTGVY